MKIYTKIIAFSMLIAITSCGGKDSASESKKQSASIAPATVMLVPLDSEGKEDISRAEMRTVSADVKGRSGDELIQLFNQGQAIKPVEANDQLDESSTQSWFGWRRHRQSGACGNYNYCDYQPRVHSCGQNYQYQRVVQTTVTCTRTVQGCCQQSAGCCANNGCGSMNIPNSSPTYRTGYQDQIGVHEGYLAPQIAPIQYNAYAWQFGG